MKADLHIHTVHSDGTETIDDVINYIQINPPELISITDHDTIAGYREFLEKINSFEKIPSIISGVEVTCTFEYHNKLVSVHVLGYDFDCNNNEMNNLLQKNRDIRSNGLESAIMDLYKKGKISRTYKEICSLYGKSDLHITHIYSALFSEKISLDRINAFKKLLTFEKMLFSTVEEAVQVIKNAGGIAVLAHPRITCGSDSDLLNSLLAYNFDGLEVFYPDHTLNDIVNYLKIVKDRKLIMTGGSDYHGDYSKASSPQIGEIGLTDVKTFSKKLERKRKL